MNIVYNEVLVYDTLGKNEFFNSNISNYDVHPWHTGDYSRLKEFEINENIKLPYRRKGDESQDLLDKLNRFRSQSFEVFLDHDYSRHHRYTVDEISGKGINYIYPIIIYSNEIFEKYDTIDINEKVIKDALIGNCKICFMQPTEGFFGQSVQNYVWLNNLSNKYGLSSKSLFIITTNFIAKESKQQLENLNHIEKGKFTILEYSYFSSNLWFHHPGHVTDPHSDIEGRKLLSDFVTSSLTKKKRYHFLNFNRIPKLHRVILFGVLKGKEIFKDKFITSMGGHPDESKDFYHNWVHGQVPPIYEKGWKNDILKFYSTHDSREHAWYDDPDLENNKADSFNIKAHTESFVNIVSESLISSDTVFFSEKIYKPIFAAQPFILVGNPNSLRKLKDEGYRTFDKWWDESYDSETDFHCRMDKIIKVMEEIATWDMDKCFKVTQEMMPDLIHNYNVLMSGNTLKELLKDLDKFEEIKQNIKVPPKNLI